MRVHVISFFIAISLGASIFSMQLTRYTFEARRDLAKKLLALDLNEKNSAEIEQLFREDNERVLAWFETHKHPVEQFLTQTFPDIQLKIMGSRRWGTAHLLSDIDAAAVTNEPNSEKVVDMLSEWYTQHFPQIKQFRIKTIAGLSLLTLKNFEDNALGHMKLEYTIQSPEANARIISGMNQLLAQKFKSTEERTKYALAMMAAVYENDEQKQLQLKEWTRVLVKN